MSSQGKVAVGHPVDVATGTMFNTWLDFAVPGVVPLSVTRFYSSALASRGASGPIGLGWRHGLQHELRQTVEGFAYVDAEGAEIAIEDVDGVFEQRGRLVVARDQLELRGTLDEVELVPYGPGQSFSYWFHRRRGTTRYVLRALGRNHGLRLELEHDASDRITRVVQKRSGRALALEHDANGRITTVYFESEGRRELAVRYAYDAAGQLVAVSDRIGQVSRYEYDPAGLMLSEIHCLGSVHTFRYDASSRCVYASGADRFEERQLTFFPKEHRTEVADSHGAVTSYVYNDAGQVLETTNPLGEKQRYEYDADGRMVGITDARGKSARMEYDRWGHLCAATYPDGKKAITTFDERHLPLAISDYWGNVWRYEYDSDGQLSRSVNPSGHEWTYSYNAHGEVVRVRNPAGGAALMGWDRAGNPSAFRGADGGEWTKEFDHYGRCVAQRDPAGAVTRFEFDAAGHLVRTVHPDGRASRVEHDHARRTWTTIGPDGGRMTTVLNACRKPLEQWLPDGSVVRFAWDTEPGRLLSITDATGRSIRYRYDAAGRLAERTHWDGSSNLFERDALGNLTALVDAAGGRTLFAYDDWGNMVRRTAPDGKVTAFSYDANALPVRIETAHAVVELERDFYGRVQVERQNGVAVASRYDAAGHRLELRSDLGAAIDYGWTPGGNCASVGTFGATIRFEYDAVGREIARELPGGWRFEQSYDPCGRVATQALLRASQPVDPASAPGARGEPALRREYGYDAAGHVAQVSDSLRGAARFVHDRLGRLHAVVRQGEQIECYGYDAAHNRSFAIRAAGPAVAPLVRELDRTGAIEPRELTPGEEVERARRGATNATIRLTRGDRKIAYDYDARGRLTHKLVESPGGREEWSFEWDGSGQLVALRRPDGARWSYQYDGLGRRIAKIAPDGARRSYVWDGTVVLHEHGGTAPPTTTISHPVRATPLIRERAGRAEFVLADGLGSTSETVTEDGAITWRAQRGTWGEPSIAAEGAPGFPGQQLDAESGLYYNLHRYYDPELGKYVSPDPIGVLGGLNEYAYVPSPVEWTDPLGLYTTGGPLGWDPATKFTGNGYPDLHSPGQRFVTNPVTGNSNVIPASSPAAGSGGKTLALVDGMPGGPHAFVSGFGDPTAVPKSNVLALFGDKTNGVPGLLGGKGVTSHGMGNWDHAEIQALTWLHANRESIPDSGIHLYIDRPPCTKGGGCNEALHTFLEASGLGDKVSIHYAEPDPKKKGGVIWNDFTC